MGKLDLTGSLPPYLQVADAVSSEIAAGVYAPGDRLPSLNDLASRYGVAVGTVKSALGVLRDKSVVVTRHGSGTFVHPDVDPEALEPIGGTGRSLATDVAEVLSLLHDISRRLTAIEDKLSVRLPD
jgi:DNA-binding GntR family transcriptional regulator